MDLAVGGNLVCFLIIVDIFIVLGRAVDWGGILKLSYGGKATKGCMGKVPSSRHHVKNLMWQLEEG